MWEESRIEWVEEVNAKENDVSDVQARLSSKVELTITAKPIRPTSALDVSYCSM